MKKVIDMSLKLHEIDKDSAADAWLFQNRTSQSEIVNIHFENIANTYGKKVLINAMLNYIEKNKINKKVG